MLSPSDFKKTVSDNVAEIMASNFTTQNITTIPESARIPLEGTRWLYAENVTCVYADLVGSTQLQISKTPLISAKVYQIFIESLVRTFNNFDAEYVDIKGDGAFALFMGPSAPIFGLCAAVTFKTICNKILSDKIPGFPIKSHIGIDHKSVLVKRIGLRGDRQNEVWAGKPVNMAAKLASLAAPDTVLVSERVFSLLDAEKYRDCAVMSCGCSGTTSEPKPVKLWEEMDLSGYSYFDFPKAYTLKSYWCDTHGDDFCKKLISLASK